MRRVLAAGAVRTIAVQQAAAPDGRGLQLIVGLVLHAAW